MEPTTAVEDDSASTTSSVSRPQTPQVMPDLPGPDVPADDVAAAAVTAASALPPPAPKSKRQKEPLNLTEEQEQDVADWHRPQEMLYNRRLAE